MEDIYNFLHQAVGFEWDKHNFRKNWEKNGITPYECEQVFFNQPFIVAEEVIHSEVEDRFFALGKTDVGTKLFVVFTILKKLIRIISARQMNKKEKTSYGKYEKK